MQPGLTFSVLITVDKAKEVNKMTVLLSFDGFSTLYLLMCCCSCIITTADSQDGIVSEPYTHEDCGKGNLT